jgi:hypothetical protein
MQCGRADRQVLESELNALGFLLAFDASQQSRDLDGSRDERVYPGTAAR